ncbi:sugar kinase [Kitasatospora sp. NPDC096147]|uniref:sugar kinase n=1 Tax=Kitasatospora sp. NPDC096147 TaxID=3364093 RepID=UPI003825CB74
MSGVLTLGETMAALRTEAPLRLGGPARLSVAGSESNVAIGLARLGHRADWLGVVGADQPGELVLRTLRAEGVGLRYARTTADAATGFIAFDRAARDVTRVSYHRRGSAGSTLTAAEAEAAVAGCAPERVHLTGITPALSGTAGAAVLAAARTARTVGARVSLDVNYRARLWSRAEAAAALRALLPLVDTVFASEDELDLLTSAEDAVPALLAAGVPEVVVTAGAAGARAHTPGRSHVRAAAATTVADSIGAGDAFVAGYLSAALDGLPVGERLARGVVAGAFCVGGHGDWESLPTRADLALLAHGDGTALR